MDQVNVLELSRSTVVVVVLSLITSFPSFCNLAELCEITSPSPLNFCLTLPGWFLSNSCALFLKDLMPWSVPDREERCLSPRLHPGAVQGNRLSSSHLSSHVSWENVVWKGNLVHNLFALILFWALAKFYWLRGQLCWMPLDSSLERSRGWNLIDIIELSSWKGLCRLSSPTLGSVRGLQCRVYCMAIYL